MDEEEDDTEHVKKRPCRRTSILPIRDVDEDELSSRTMMILLLVVANIVICRLQYNGGQKVFW